MVDSIHIDVAYTLDVSDHEESKDLNELLAAIEEDSRIHTTVTTNSCLVCVQIRYYTHLLPETIRALFDRMAGYIERLQAKELDVEQA